VRFTEQRPQSAVAPLDGDYISYRFEVISSAGKPFDTTDPSAWRKAFAPFLSKEEHLYVGLQLKAPRDNVLNPRSGEMEGPAIVGAPLPFTTLVNARRNADKAFPTLYFTHRATILGPRPFLSTDSQLELAVGLDAGTKFTTTIPETVIDLSKFLLTTFSAGALGLPTVAVDLVFGISDAKLADANKFMGGVLSSRFGIDELGTIVPSKTLTREKFFVEGRRVVVEIFDTDLRNRPTTPVFAVSAHRTV